jgi:predicted dithiol-disulfide oxidoreductase (DUF899 family)
MRQDIAYLGLSAIYGHDPHKLSHHPDKEESIHMTDGTIENHMIVSQEEWMLLEKEKQFARSQDELNLERRSLPWVKLTKEFVFDGPSGKEALGDLFAGRSQLIVYHFMFAPESKAGCPHCSLRADGFNGINIHLKDRATSP